MGITIRKEQPANIHAIFALTQAAFAPQPFSTQTEQFITNALRSAGALMLSLVADREEKVAGHAAFSPVTISDGTQGWYGLGPLSVLPELQKQGIGQSLVREGLSQLKALGAQGCVVLGDPEYYQRFGFAHNPALVYEMAAPKYFMALAFESGHAAGKVLFHPAFEATEDV